MVPIAMTAGFVALGLYPTLAVLVVVQVAYRAGRYGLTKPACEMLWTVLGREEKYKAKPFLDAAVYRGGDLVSIAAPGEVILTAFPGGGWAVASGTSFAAPWIAGGAAIASRIAARSTTAGTPVKSCINTRAGRKAIS